MDILVIGGTRFVGRHTVEIAHRRGHSLTLFNRGQSNPGLYEDLDDVEQILGDRDGDLGLLSGRRWDVVFDTCGYVPRVVRASAEFLAQAAERYLFISTISVYRDPLAPGAGEDAPLAALDDDTTEAVTGETYGGLKVLCERAVADVFAERALIIRPGLIVGPYDPTDRFTYWPVRVARGGDVLAPGDGTVPVQFIDVRDLAQWAVTCLENGANGIYNATGPASKLRMRDFLQTCRDATDGEATFIWVDDQLLQTHDVAPYTELPLWIPGDEGVAFGTVQITRALEDGLTLRPLRETIIDTLRWAEARGSQYEWRAGLDPEREESLLKAWAEASRPS